MSATALLLTEALPLFLFGTMMSLGIYLAASYLAERSSTKPIGVFVARLLWVVVIGLFIHGLWPAASFSGNAEAKARSQVRGKAFSLGTYTIAAWFIVSLIRLPKRSEADDCVN